MAATRPTDDDELPALPPLDGDVDDEPKAPRHDGEDDELDEGDEKVGLDATTNEDDLESELDGADEEGESFLEGSEPGEIDDGEDEELAAGEDERGWRAFADTDVAEEEEADGPDGEALATLDRGEEGLVDDEPVRGTESDDAELPPSVAAVGAPDLPDESLDVSDAGELEAPDLPADAERRLSGVDVPAPLPASRVTASWLELDGIVVALATTGGDLWAAGSSLVHVGARRVEMERLAAQGLETAFVTSLAPHPSDPRRIVAGTRLGGAFASRDGGEHFAPANAWRREGGHPTSAFHVSVEPHAGGVRLWGLAGGALYRSEDFGEHWAGPLLVAPVAAFAACGSGEGGVAALALAQGSARLLRSADGGLGWSSRALPPPPRRADARDATSTPRLALARDVVALAYDRDPRGALLLVGDAERRVPELAAAVHLAFTVEADGVALWAVLFFPGTDRSVLVRRGADGALSTVADVAALGAARSRAGDLHDEGDGRVLALALAHEEERDTAWLATPRGVLRVVVAR